MGLHWSVPTTRNLARTDLIFAEVFAMAPLGVITAFVGAIRVHGPEWLKAFIGRAKENLADVELEMMSSVSPEVREVWNGRAIVRTEGGPPVKMIVHIPKNDKDFSPESFITLDQNSWDKELGYSVQSVDKDGKSCTVTLIITRSHDTNREQFLRVSGTI